MAPVPAVEGNFLHKINSKGTMKSIHVPLRSWSRAALFGNLIVALLVKKIDTFYGT
jgi:hypothetical protein